MILCNINATWNYTGYTTNGESSQTKTRRASEVSISEPPGNQVCTINYKSGAKEINFAFMICLYIQQKKKENFDSATPIATSFSGGRFRSLCGYENLREASLGFGFSFGFGFGFGFLLQLLD